MWHTRVTKIRKLEKHTSQDGDSGTEKSVESMEDRVTIDIDGKVC
jgi:hypothetical protein